MKTFQKYKDQKFIFANFQKENIQDTTNLNENSLDEDAYFTYN